MREDKKETKVESLSTSQILSNSLESTRARFDNLLDTLCKENPDLANVATITNPEQLRKASTSFRKATSSQEYLAVLRRLVFPEEEARFREGISVPVHWLREKNANKESWQPKLPDERQVRADMERDRVFINGQAYIGAETKFDGLVTAVRNCIMKAQTDMKTGLSSLATVKEEEKIDKKAFDILRVGCRTASAGDSFEAANAVLSSEHILLMPDSTSAEPIRIEVGVGAFPGGWGIGASVNVTTVFKICAPMTVAMDEPELLQRIAVTYRRKWLLDEGIQDESMNGKVDAQKTGGGRFVGDGGAVLFSLLDTKYVKQRDPQLEFDDEDFSESEVDSSSEKEIEDDIDADEEESDDDFQYDDEGKLILPEPTGDPVKDEYKRLQLLKRVERKAKQRHRKKEKAVAFRRKEKEKKIKNQFGSKSSDSTFSDDDERDEGSKNESTQLTTIKKSSDIFWRDDIDADEWQAVACTEVFCIGSNEHGVLGVGDLDTRRSASMTIIRSDVVGLARVRSISCSALHSVAVTDLGLVYTWGSGSEGALGLGPMMTDDVAVPQLVQSLATHDPPVTVTSVSAGGEMLGAHSAAVTSNGELFMWGLGVAVGLGGGTNVGEATMVSEDDLGGNNAFVVEAACGGAFTLAVLANGDVYSWGKWAGGRLGLGAPKSINARARGRIFKRSRNPRFQLRPKRVKAALQGRVIKSVAAGEAHALAVDEKGRLYSWGRGSSGQLGTGSSRDALQPVRVNPNMKNGGGKMKFGKVQSVACGTNTSAAVDGEGRLWTWGGGGRRVLGLGLPLGRKSTGRTAAMQMQTLRRLEEDEESPEARKRRGDWFLPQHVDAMRDVREVSLGANHMACVTRRGSLYIWGKLEGIPLVPVPRLLACVSRRNDEKNKNKNEEEPGAIGQRRILSVSCGGSRLFALGQGSSLGESLYEELERSAAVVLSTESLEPTGCDCTIFASGRPIYAHRIILGLRSERFREMLSMERTSRHAELLLPELSYDAAVLLVRYLYRDNVPASKLPPGSALAQELNAAASSFGLPRLEQICSSAMLRGQLSMITNSSEVSATSEDLVKDPSLAAQVMKRMRQMLRSTLSDDLGLAVGNPAFSDVVFVPSGGRSIHAHRVIVMARSAYFQTMFNGIGMDNGDPDPKTGRAAVVEVRLPDRPLILLAVLRWMYTGHLDLQDLCTGAVESKGSSSTSRKSPMAVIELLQAAERYELPQLCELIESECEDVYGVALRRKEKSKSSRDAAAVACAQTLQIATSRRAECMRQAMLHTMAAHLHILMPTAGTGKGDDTEKLKDEGEVKTSSIFTRAMRQSSGLREQLLNYLQRREKRRVVLKLAAEARLRKPPEIEVEPEPFPWVSFLLVLTILIILFVMIYASPQMGAYKDLIPFLNGGAFLFLVFISFLNIRGTPPKSGSNLVKKMV